uniref:Uncharacterized protein n=1 Tax=Anas platyrhynchos platyrhynchos TaxID=8840 RepID=A0A493TI61_ANAPP
YIYFFSYRIQKESIARTQVLTKKLQLISTPNFHTEDKMTEQGLCGPRSILAHIFNKLFFSFFCLIE